MSRTPLIPRNPRLFGNRSYPRSHVHLGPAPPLRVLRNCEASGPFAMPRMRTTVDRRKGGRHGQIKSACRRWRRYHDGNPERLVDSDHPRGGRGARWLISPPSCSPPTRTGGLRDSDARSRSCSVCPPWALIAMFAFGLLDE